MVHFLCIFIPTYPTKEYHDSTEDLSALKNNLIFDFHFSLLFLFLSLIKDGWDPSYRPSIGLMARKLYDVMYISNIMSHNYVHVYASSVC
jgi:hypothetical protein